MMRPPVRSSVRLLAVFVAGVVMASGPQIAIAAFDATNADKVDGRHAVAASATKAARAGKLVATNADGYLPNDIILRVANSNQLDGLDSTAFQRRVTGACAPGASIRAIAAGGAVTCDPDAVDGGNAELLDGKDSSEFQPLILKSCPGGFIRSIDIMSGAQCGPDAIDGGDAETLDGLDSAAFASTLGGNVIYVRGDGTPTANGQALAAAVDAPSATAVILVGPGTFSFSDTSLVLTPGVSLVGAGRADTILNFSGTGQEGEGGAVVLGDGSELRNVRITHGATFNTTTVLVEFDDTARLEDVEVISTSASPSAVVARSSAALDVVDSKIEARATVNEQNYPVLALDGATVTIRGSDLNARNLNSPGGEAAVASLEGSEVWVEGSVLTSTGKVAQTPGTPGTVRIATSRLDGATAGLGQTTCFGNYDENLAAVTCTP